jgi:hypothetical protein
MHCWCGAIRTHHLCAILLHALQPQSNAQKSTKQSQIEGNPTKYLSNTPQDHQGLKEQGKTRKLPHIKEGQGTWNRRRVLVEKVRKSQ